MADNHNPIDDLFRKAMEGAELPAPEGVWESVSAGLGQAGAAGTGIAAGWITALKIAAVAAAGAGLLWLGSGLFKEASNNATSPVVQATNGAPNGESKASEQDASGNVPYTAEQQSENFKKPSNVNSTEDKRRISGYHGTESPKPSEQNQPSVPVDPSHPVSGQESSRKPPASSDVNQGSGADPCKTLAQPEFQHVETSPAVVEFTAGAGYTNCRWTFEDGKTAQGAQVKHTLVNRNRMKVTLSCNAANGCALSTEQFVSIQGSDLEGNLLIPNVFTPNADGINDPYRVLIVGAETFRLSVFDKEGKLLFTTTDAQEGWDGTINGIACATGMYVARVNWKFYGHEEESKTVAIWLKR